MSAEASVDSTPNLPAEASNVSARASLIRMSIPYWVLLLTQLPLLTVYVRNLWIRQPHYRFLPFLVIVIAWLVWDRWPRNSQSPIRKSIPGSIYLGLGVLCAIAATVFVNPWFAACATCCFLTSWLSRIQDAESNRSLLLVGFLSFLGLQFPLGFDVRLIQYLQRISAYCSSKILELFGQMHDMPGTVLIFPGRETYFVEEACSGVQSLFTLLFCAGAYAVWRRYGLQRMFVLLAAAAGWAILMNSLRILAIPMAEIHLNLDLVTGWKHEMLGYVALVMAILLLVSTDRLLSVVMMPIQLDEDAVKSAKRMAKQNLGWWPFKSKNADAKQRTQAPARQPRYAALWGLAMLLGIAGIWQAVDVRNMLFGRQRNVSFFSEVEIVKLDEKDLPVSVGPWTCQEFVSEDRTRTSELGEHSDTWTYESDRYVSLVSLDQPFPGWHELSVCYTNQGWRLLERKRISATSTRDNKEWPYVEITFENDLGEFGYLIFSFFDVDGEPFDAPEDWDTMTSLYYRIQNRLSSRIREQIVQSETYQAQVFVPATRPLGENELEEIRQNYLIIREQLRSRLLERRAGEPLDSTTSL